jgi:hypothetical protein
MESATFEPKPVSEWVGATLDDTVSSVGSSMRGGAGILLQFTEHIREKIN